MAKSRHALAGQQSFLKRPAGAEQYLGAGRHTEEAGGVDQQGKGNWVVHAANDGKRLKWAAAWVGQAAGEAPAAPGCPACLRPCRLLTPPVAAAAVAADCSSAAGLLPLPWS